MIDAFALSNNESRNKMEDYVKLIKNFGNNPDWIFGGVFDGHGGDTVARQAFDNISIIVLKT